MKQLSYPASKANEIMRAWWQQRDVCNPKKI